MRLAYLLAQLALAGSAVSTEDGFPAMLTIPKVACTPAVVEEGLELAVGDVLNIICVSSW